MKRQPRADVCVVGAGPAGLAAAEALIAGGARVVLVDRHPRPGGKACGGGLSAEARSELERLGIATVGPEFDRLEVRAPRGAVTLDDTPGIAVIDRRAWIAGWLERLADRGCELRLGQRLTGVERRGVITDGGRIPCARVVGADGTASRVRRSLRLTRGLAVRAWQLVVEEGSATAELLEVDAPTVWFDPARFGAGYGWLFPAPGELRIGCGASTTARDKGALRDAFFDWLGALRVAPDAGRIESGTIGCGYQGHRFGSVSLAGDAAGLASPLTGEGIAQALVSGREVAREILEPGYRSAAIPLLGRRHRRTHDVLVGLDGAPYRLAPALLRLEPLRAEALRRYAS
jgi:geranylgeranyl reductase